jgi:hypothetical protein
MSGKEDASTKSFAGHSSRPEARSCWKQEHMVYNPIVPAFGLAEAFGYREQESLYLMQNDLRDNPKPEDLPPSARV